MPTPTPRHGARVLLLDPGDRVLLIHARDPDNPTHHWWELPGGGIDPDETPEHAALRELTEETGLTTITLGRHLYTRESRFHYRGTHHHRIDHVYLAHTRTTTPTLAPEHTSNEKAGLIEQRWWNPHDLMATTDKLLPPTLPQLLDDLLHDRLGPLPLSLTS
ncbi:Dihydroneopterin triphosphate pyrophosphohydolase, putative, Actinobacterial type, NudB-like protein [Actinokineospora spheciospongiae]|uniref:Dihydroneopterin triphosphate pyrophosphohydolase, putative, Actinobacterial type, NudB-like protein n=1 Tax=Actinokineospora spheciospongiae TaxID=909613 RepID=W7IPL2_9PSEU|nr:NUDIX domain-containing protein [Actinokineospora spheciospongiae]EWC58667.1 Dihydroneopterin triphosphate pyrophosphohydolase, putative, Actinobacterial type, NudB-like protein [Actinokineospora spheciospongiae]